MIEDFSQSGWSTTQTQIDIATRMWILSILHCHKQTLNFSWLSVSHRSLISVLCDVSILLQFLSCKCHQGLVKPWSLFKMKNAGINLGQYMGQVSRWCDILVFWHMCFPFLFVFNAPFNFHQDLSPVMRLKHYLVFGSGIL